MIHLNHEGQTRELCLEISARVEASDNYQTQPARSSHLNDVAILVVLCLDWSQGQPGVREGRQWL